MMILANIISLTIMFAVPLLLVALGGMFSEHSGVINLGLEGIHALLCEQTQLRAGVLVQFCRFGSRLRLHRLGLFLRLRYDTFRLCLGFRNNLLCLGITFLYAFCVNLVG